MDQTTFKKLNEKLGDYGVYRYLDISTAHITENDARLLKAGLEPEEAFLIGTYDEGFVLSLTESVGELEPNQFSPEFNEIIHYAQLQGCVLLRLDSDGMEFPDFPTFDW